MYIYVDTFIYIRSYICIQKYNSYIYIYTYTHTHIYVLLERAFAAEAKWASAQFKISWQGNFEPDRSPFGVSGKSSLQHSKSHCEVTQETEPVMTALPDQDMVFRAWNAPTYGCSPPPCASAGTTVWMLGVQDSNWGPRKVTLSELSPLTPNGLQSSSKLPGQVISNRTEAHLASAAKVRSNTHVHIHVYSVMHLLKKSKTKRKHSIVQQIMYVNI